MNAIPKRNLEDIPFNGSDNTIPFPDRADVTGTVQKEQMLQENFDAVITRLDKYIRQFTSSHSVPPTAKNLEYEAGLYAAAAEMCGKQLEHYSSISHPSADSYLEEMLELLNISFQIQELNGLDAFKVIGQHVASAYRSAYAHTKDANYLVDRFDIFTEFSERLRTTNARSASTFLNASIKQANQLYEITCDDYWKEQASLCRNELDSLTSVFQNNDAPAVTLK